MGKVYIGVMGVGGYKLWGWWAEWFGGDAVISGRRKIDGRRREGCGPGMPGPYGGWWMVGGCWPGGAGGIYAAPTE